MIKAEVEKLKQPKQREQSLSPKKEQEKGVKKMIKDQMSKMDINF